ncbi:hypothetical protein PILCRDRAFT_4046 [Piloderma croceum F 1598]|uniref:Arrestin-like N-terminal domain-containing protein n=1 Tax=Piloderma croceum (strain F 1598) TaxID=765440 RepID=A0A0C3FTK8_PILCF|nr:hypothetical protein PILCRDRAFT_4046 [Piloderma croceum F 1598]
MLGGVRQPTPVLHSTLNLGRGLAVAVPRERQSAVIIAMLRQGADPSPTAKLCKTFQTDYELAFQLVMSHKNSLTISLAESVVFRTNGRRPNDPSPPSMLRGLLILNLCKPTRISSIELELTGKSTASWPQAVGSRCVNVTEEHEIFNASTVFFRAGSTDKGRDGWKEFQKGVYTYPISFMIPGNAPPTLECLKGNVTWRLNGQVHREDDTEDTENIIVRRQWDSQLQYFLSISGRSFYIGGTLPIQITILPMAKIKIHGISVILEGACYALYSKRIARTDPIRRFSLLSLKVSSQESESILPIISDDPEAFKHLPFYETVTPEDDPSGVPSNLMGPGPWSFQRDLALPTSCTQVIFRVERGDDKYVDQKTGNGKLFDIIMQTPVNILSCRCTPEWTSLPCYNKFTYDDSAATPPSCPCIVKNIPSVQTRELSRGLYDGLDRIPSRQSTESVSTVESSSINSISILRGDSLYDLNTQFERLVSGQESEFGEAPPAYYAAVWQTPSQP